MRAQPEVHDFRIGLKVGWPLIAAAAAYVALTWGQPHRGAMAVLIGVGAVLAASVLLPHLQRLIERGNADALMTGWCCAFVGLAATLCLLDRELHSPFVGVFFVSVSFAAIAPSVRGRSGSHRRRSFIAWPASSNSVTATPGATSSA